MKVDIEKVREAINGGNDIKNPLTGEHLKTLQDIASLVLSGSLVPKPEMMTEEELEKIFPSKVEKPKPTIAELEKILQEEGEGKIYIKPDGSITGGKAVDVYAEGFREGANKMRYDCKQAILSHIPKSMEKKGMIKAIEFHPVLNGYTDFEKYTNCEHKRNNQLGSDCQACDTAWLIERCKLVEKIVFEYIALTASQEERIIALLTYIPKRQEDKDVE